MDVFERYGTMPGRDYWSRGLTVTVALPRTAGLNTDAAVMTAWPAATALTTPVVLTLATLLVEVVHMTPRSVTFPETLTETASVTSVPTAMVSELGLTVTWVTSETAMGVRGVVFSRELSHDKPVLATSTKARKSNRQTLPSIGALLRQGLLLPCR